MSDLDPHPALRLDDPSVTRLARRGPAELDTPRLRRVEAGLVTSVTVVVPAAADLPAAADRLGAWRPGRLRLQVVAVVERSTRGRDVLGERLRSTGLSGRIVERPPGGRAAALATGVEAADNEFVLVLGAAAAPYGLLGSALATMWADGVDAVLLGPSSVAHAGEPDADAADALVDALGLTAPPRDGGAVLLRRWVAKWLFNEATRAIDPAVEVADRARLLGIGIVAVVEDQPHP
jgi:hypothetical protein